MSPLTLTDSDHASFSLTGHGVELLRYTYRSDAAAAECPAPYLHPLRTLGGQVVTAHRPHDHRWHKGLAMTLSHVSGANFWGGPTFDASAPGHGYVQLDNVGHLRHDRFDVLECDGRELRFAERVTWVTAQGEEWITELRTVRVHDVDPGTRTWALEFGTALTNIRGRDLDLGSPTTAGRPDAGYTGLFWRGPRDMTHGTVLTDEDPGGEDAMGRATSWLAYRSPHDEVDAASTLIFHQDPAHAGAPDRWFVRSEPFPAVAFSLAFHEEVVLPAGETLRRRYRIVVADGLWERDAIGGYLKEHPW
ncbi:oxidoreductase [Sphaerisporangium melleum]|uniref:Oxidoreductase n=1 Tax=Sphaerisporangium melleum TaxID=321316 RepID=A0A917RPW4_9ACTN|nr:PmoA family protein [Sphaerisporangium melleum]GGL17677.1 oxidoreductase [Sphaerisporangium melleum]GII74833.1 oxidoreductase [Sphaerisporangium melleum]